MQFQVERRRGGLKSASEIERMANPDAISAREKAGRCEKCIGNRENGRSRCMSGLSLIDVHAYDCDRCCTMLVYAIYQTDQDGCATDQLRTVQHGKADVPFMHEDVSGVSEPDKHIPVREPLSAV